MRKGKKKRKTGIDMGIGEVMSKYIKGSIRKSELGEEELGSMGKISMSVLVWGWDG